MKAKTFLARWGTVLAVPALCILFSVLMPATFMTTDNAISILRSISVVTVIAVGLTISLAAGGFDLSVGSGATLGGTVVMTCFVWYELGLVPSILIALLCSALVGGTNALLSARLKIPDMLATLSAMFIFEGIATTYAGGGSVTESMSRLDGTPTTGTVPVLFKSLGRAPWIILIMLVVVLLAYLFLEHTKAGRCLYMVGGNPEAAYLSGIPTAKFRTLAYLLCALLATLGGVLLAARNGAAQIGAGGGLLMPAVAAAYIGFSFGGRGRANALGTLLGAALIGVLENGLVMLSFPYYAVNIVKGGVLALALALTYVGRKQN